MNTTAKMRAPARCVPGRERDAYDLLVELDDYSITVDELMHEIPKYEGPVVSDLRLMSWTARECFAPELLAEITPNRLMITRVDLSTYTDRQLHSVTIGTIADSVLVSSLREDGVQQPALDLDYPAGLYKDQDGGVWLNLQVNSPAVDYHGPEAVDWADRAMAFIGLHRAAGRPTGPLKDLSPYGRVAGALGETWGGTFETLWASALNLEYPQDIAPQDIGTWYRVSCDAAIVPSTSWWHLYLSTELPTGQYLQAINTLAACGILNPGFANGSLNRGFTSLRRPGLKKPPVIPYPEQDDSILF